VVDQHDFSSMLEERLSELKLQLSGWINTTKRAVQGHEATAVDAERRYRLKQLKQKNDELAALGVRLSLLAACL
jgi:hypothetical protein